MKNRVYIDLEKEVENENLNFKDENNISYVCMYDKEQKTLYYQTKEKDIETIT